MYNWMNVDDEEVEINVTIRSDRNDNLSVQLHETNLKDVEPIALIDSGAQGRFIDESVIGNGRRRALKQAIIVKNIDGT